MGSIVFKAQLGGPNLSGPLPILRPPCSF